MNLTNAQLALRGDYLNGPQGTCFGIARTLDDIEVRITNLSFHRTYPFSGIIKGDLTDEVDQFVLREIEKFAKSMSIDGNVKIHMIPPQKIVIGEESRLPLFFSLIDLESLGTQDGHIFSGLRVVTFNDEFDFGKPLDLTIGKSIGEVDWKASAQNFSP